MHRRIEPFESLLLDLNVERITQTTSDLRRNYGAIPSPLFMFYFGTNLGVGPNGDRRLLQ